MTLDRISDEGSIQMVTALILQLVQCMVQPSTDDESGNGGKVLIHTACNGHLPGTV